MEKPQDKDQSAVKTNSMESEKSSVEKGSEKSSVEKGSEKSSVEKGSEKSSVEKGSEKSSVETGSEKSSVEKGSEKSSVEKGSEKSSVEKGTEKSSVEKGSENSSVEKGSEKSSVEKDSAAGNEQPLPAPSTERKLKGTKEEQCEEKLLPSLPKQRKKRPKTAIEGGSKKGSGSKKRDPKKKDPKMDIYIETVISNTGNSIQGDGADSGTVILQAIVDCAVSETLRMQTFGNTIIEDGTYEISTSATEESTAAGNISNQSDANNAAKNTKAKRKDEEMLISIDTGMVVEVVENMDGIESTSIPVNTPEKGPGYGYMSYAHNFGVDAETDDKEGEAIANLTGDEQDNKDKPKEKTTLQPQYTVQSGYSPKSCPQTPKTNATKKTSNTDASESAIKKSKKSSLVENEITTSLPASSSKTKTGASNAKTKVKNNVSTKAKNVVSTKVKNVVSTKAKNVVSTKAKNVVSTKAKNVVSTKAKNLVSTKSKNVAPTKAKSGLSKKTEEDVATKTKTVVSSKVKNVVSSKAKNVVSSKAKNVVSTKAQKKTGATLKATQKTDSKTSPKKGKNSPVNLDTSPKEDSKEPQKEVKKKASKTRKTKIDRINKVMAALNNSPTNSADNTIEHLETNLSPTKDKTKKKKKSRTKDKDRKDKDKKKRRKHKSSKDKHEFSGSKKKKKKAKKDKSPEKSEGSLDSLESPRHHHHHHKPKKKSRKDKGKHRKKSESEPSPVDKLSEEKIKKLSDTISRLESTIESEKLDSKTKHSTTQKSPTKKRPLEKLYDIDVAEHTPTICRKPSNTKKQTKKKTTTACKSKSKSSLVHEGNASENKKQINENSKAEILEEPKLNISTPLHIDIPEDKPVQYTKGVGRGRGRGRRKYGTSRILAVKKTYERIPETKKDEQLPEENDMTTRPSIVVPEEKDISVKQTNDNIEKETDQCDLPMPPKKKPSDDIEKDNKNKEQTPSPQSATTCMSEEGLFSDSGIGTDNNSNADHQANEKSRKNNDVEIPLGVMSSHPLATSAHGLYGYGKKEKTKKQMNWPVTLGRRKRKKHRLLRTATRITPEFIFELDALVLQLRALKLDHPEELDDSSLSMAGKKNHLSSLVKLTTGFSTMLRPSYLGAVMNIHTDKLKQKKKKKGRHKRRELKENSDEKLTSPVSHHSGEPSESGETSPLKSVEDDKTTGNVTPFEGSPMDTSMEEQTEPQVSIQKTAEENNVESLGVENVNSSIVENPEEAKEIGQKGEKERRKEDLMTVEEKDRSEVQEAKDVTEVEEPNVMKKVEDPTNERPVAESNQELISETPQRQTVKATTSRFQRTRRRRGKGRGFTRKKIRGTYQSKKFEVVMSEVNIDSVNNAIYEGNDVARIAENDDSDRFEDAVEIKNQCFNSNLSEEVVSSVVPSVTIDENVQESVDFGCENSQEQSEETIEKHSKPDGRTKSFEIIKTNKPVKTKRKPGRPKQPGRKPGRPRKNPLPEIVDSPVENYSKEIVYENNNLSPVDNMQSDIYSEECFRESNTFKDTESAVIIEQESLFLRRSPNINISPNNEHVPVEKLYESTNHEFDSVKRKIDAAIKACVDKIKNTKRNVINVSHNKYIAKPGPKRRGGVLGPKTKPNITEATLTQEDVEPKKNNTNKPRLKAVLLSQHETKKQLSEIKIRKSHNLSAIDQQCNEQGSELTTVSDDSSVEDDDEYEECEPLPTVPTITIGSVETDILETVADHDDPSTSEGLNTQKKVLKVGKGDKRKAISENVECKLPLKKRKLTLTDGTSLTSETSLQVASPTVDDTELKETSVLPGVQTIKGFDKGSKGRKRRAEQRRRDDKPPKKKYWKAGMYSNSFKDDAVPKKSGKSGDELIERPASGYLPKPIHVGRYLREKRRDFTLPYDLWWLSMRKKLLSRQDTISFKKIRTNLHVDVKPSAGLEHVRCSCIAPPLAEPGCGEDCINRMTFTECNIDTCPCGEQCSNQRIQRHQWCPDLERFMTVDRGWGIMTKTSIRQHQFILEYVGEVISVKEFMKRATTDYQHRKHHYCLNLDSTQVIDGHRAGNEGRFVNHSCEPNCEMQKWCVQGVYRIALFSLRDIPSNEELTYDYNFHAFSSEGQQICKCQSPSCRGYIGGRGQKPSSNGGLKNKRVGRPPKDKRKSKKTLKKLHDLSIESDSLADQRLQLPKPMSMREMKIIAERRILLIRNIEKVKRVRESLRRVHMVTSEPCTPKEDDRDVFMAQFRALNSSRSVKTRHLAAAEENTEVTTAARLAQVFKDIYTAVCTYRDTSGQCLAIPFMNLPSKKRNRDYYNRISDPIDLSTIERKIITGHYKTVNSFDEDFKTLFRNAEKYHGKKSVLGRDAVHLFKVYSSAMTTSSKQFRNIVGLKSVAESNSKEDGKKSSKEDDEEEVIRCLCGLLNDEGLMIQCDKCMVWQHYDCIGLSYDEEPDHYVCELCKPREVADEIMMIPQPKYAQPGQTYYLCLTRDDGTQIKMGDCVYLPRTEEDDNTPIILPENPTNHSDHIIFRVEQLWKNDKGERFAFGHHFLRPHETHHTPSRKFFKNELFRGPFYEIIHLDLVNGFCCVMDLYTYCKGRPKNFKEEDIYICEYRLDKTAHLFHPISKNKFPICTKSYAFNKFDKKIIPKRDYSPHYVPEHYKRGYGGRPTWKCNKDKTDDNDLQLEPSKQGFNGKVPSKQDVALKRVRKSKKNSNENRQQKQKRLNAISLGLLDKLPGKQPVDLTFLLEVTGKRQRKRPMSESFV